MTKIRKALLWLIVGIVLAGLSFLIPANIRKTTPIDRGSGLALPGYNVQSIDSHGYVLEQGWSNNYQGKMMARCMVIPTTKTASGFPLAQQEVQGGCGEDIQYNDTATILNFFFWYVILGVAVVMIWQTGRRLKLQGKYARKN